MIQIPQEGEYCGECPCLTDCGVDYIWRCNFFSELCVKVFQYGGDKKYNGFEIKRLPECLRDRPRIVREGE